MGKSFPAEWFLGTNLAQSKFVWGHFRRGFFLFECRPANLAFCSASQLRRLLYRHVRSGGRDHRHFRGECRPFRPRPTPSLPSVSGPSGPSFSSPLPAGPVSGWHSMVTHLGHLPPVGKGDGCQTGAGRLHVHGNGPGGGGPDDRGCGHPLYAISGTDEGFTGRSLCHRPGQSSEHHRHCPWPTARLWLRSSLSCWPSPSCSWSCAS